MPLVTEGVYASEFLLTEGPNGYSRDVITIGQNQVILAGTVLGQVTAGAKTAVGANGVPAPAGATITAGPTAALNTKLGAHRFECIVGGAGAASRWRHTDPAGKFIGVAIAGTAYAGGGLSALTITDAGADPTAGEAFTVTVTEADPSERFVAVAPAALDGTATAVAIAYAPVTTGAGETAQIVGIARMATVKEAVLDFGALTDDQKAQAIADLAALNPPILVQS